MAKELSNIINMIEAGKIKEAEKEFIGPKYLFWEIVAITTGLSKGDVIEPEEVNDG